MSLEKEIERVLREHNCLPISPWHNKVISDLAALLQERGDGPSRDEIENILETAQKYWLGHGEGCPRNHQSLVCPRMVEILMAWSRTGKPQRKVSREPETANQILQHDQCFRCGHCMDCEACKR